MAAQFTAAGYTLSDSGGDDDKFTITANTTGATPTIAAGTTGTSVTIDASTPGADAGTVPDRKLDAGDLVINNVAIKAAQAGDDQASYTGAASANKESSGIAIAAAINKSTGETGVTAEVNAN